MVIRGKWSEGEVKAGRGKITQGPVGHRKTRFDSNAMRALYLGQGQDVICTLKVALWVPSGAREG